MTALALQVMPWLVLVGPTASGKTELAHRIASAVNARIISADAMMVYRGMDVGTAKPAAEERIRFHYAGLDIASPDQSFSVHEYTQAVARQVAEAGPGHRWIVTGGTGLYIRALLTGLHHAPGADGMLRAEASAALEKNGIEGLVEWCELRQPGISGHIPEGDKLNPRRWIRALERGITDERGMAEVGSAAGGGSVMGIRRTREDLGRRIVQRVSHMYEQGLVDEVARLLDRGVRFSKTARHAIGYEEAVGLLSGKMSEEEARERTAIRTRQYAKRQMTWFRNQFQTHWVDVGENEDLSVVASRIIKARIHHG